MPVFLLSASNRFPPPHLATREGLLAIGGDLTRERLLQAYRQGIFPWYSEGEPILWWSPDPRLVLFPNEFEPSKSLTKIIRRQVFSLTMDRAFDRVVDTCAAVRLESDQGTWISPEIADAYTRLHAAGLAHSVEAWQEGRLAGGLYGVSLGRCFFGESMFTRVSNASKVALAGLVTFLKSHAFEMIDCQVTTQHLLRLGAREIPRAGFLKRLRKALQAPTLTGRWSFGEEPGPR